MHENGACSIDLYALETVLESYMPWSIFYIDICFGACSIELYSLEWIRFYKALGFCSIELYPLNLRLSYRAIGFGFETVL